MKLKKNIALCLAFAALGNFCVFAQNVNNTQSTTIQSIIERIENEESNKVVVYTSTDFAITLLEEDYNSLSTEEKAHLEDTYSKIFNSKNAISTLSSTYSDIITDHEHSYYGPYRETYVRRSYIEDANGVKGYVDHYVCAEATAAVCPYDRVQVTTYR